jgi:hypothetical protein
MRVEAPALSSVLSPERWNYSRLTCYRSLSRTWHWGDWASHKKGSEPEVARRNRRKNCYRQECRLGSLDIPYLTPVGLTGVSD